MSDKNLTKGTDRWVSVTPSDTVNLGEVPRAIMCNGAGDLALVGADDHVEVMTVVASFPYPIQPKRINSTSTTATGIKALY